MNQHDLSELFDDIREYISDLEQKLADRKEPSDGEYFRWESRMDNITERLAHLEQVIITYMSESTKQWTEERLRALELQMKDVRKNYFGAGVIDDLVFKMCQTLLKQGLLVEGSEEALKIREYLAERGLRHGEGSKANRKRYVEDELPANYVPVDITAAIESDLRAVRRDKGPEWEGIDPDADHGHQGEVPRPTDA